MDAPKRDARHWIMAFFGLFFVLFSLPCFAVGFDLLFLDADLAAGVMGFVIGAMIASPGALLLYLGLRKPRRKPLEIDEGLERVVLGLAHRNEGELTASQLAMASRLGVAQAQEVLENFERRNLAVSTIGQGGTMVFHFPEFKTTLSEEEDFMQRLNQSVDGDARSVVDVHAYEYEEQD